MNANNLFWVGTGIKSCLVKVCLKCHLKVWSVPDSGASCYYTLLIWIMYNRNVMNTQKQQKMKLSIRILQTALKYLFNMEHLVKAIIINQHTYWSQAPVLAIIFANVLWRSGNHWAESLVGANIAKGWAHAQTVWLVSRMAYLHWRSVSNVLIIRPTEPTTLSHAAIRSYNSHTRTVIKTAWPRTFTAKCLYCVSENNNPIVL